MAIEKAVKQLTPKQRHAIPLLASGATGKNVASALKCNPATVSQWINHDRQFQKALDAFSEGSLHLAQVQLESLVLIAIEELAGLLANAKSEQVRLKAIELILSNLGLNDIVSRKLKGKSAEDLALADAGKYDLDKLVNALTGE